MTDKIAFSVPGDNGTPIQVQTVTGMPQGSGNLNVGIQWALTLVFAFAGIVALAFVIYGGISWITSGGEKEKIQEARNKIVYALIGLVIIFASYLIVNTVGGLVGVDPFNIGGTNTETPVSCIPVHRDCSGNETMCCGKFTCKDSTLAPGLKTCE